MIEQPFSLIPFPTPYLPAIVITGTIARQDNLLSVQYALIGELEEIVLPSPSSAPGRKDELWTRTCFEFFLARETQPEYWEVNLAPSGDWNVYHMDAYRRLGFSEETRIERLPFEVRRETNTFILNATIDLNPIFQRSDRLEVGITAVIQAKDGSETYWALTHPALHADFHSRESFTLALAEQTQLSEQPVRPD